MILFDKRFKIRTSKQIRYIRVFRSSLLCDHHNVSLFLIVRIWYMNMKTEYVMNVDKSKLNENQVAICRFPFIYHQPKMFFHQIDLHARRHSCSYMVSYEYNIVKRYNHKTICLPFVSLAPLLIFPQKSIRFSISTTMYYILL